MQIGGGASLGGSCGSLQFPQHPPLRIRGSGIHDGCETTHPPATTPCRSACGFGGVGNGRLGSPRGTREYVGPGATVNDGCGTA